MSKVFHMPQKRNSGRIIVDEYDQIKREREQLFTCHFCQDSIPSRLKIQHRNVCAFKNSFNQPLISEPQQKKKQCTLNHSVYTQKEKKNAQQQTLLKLKSQRKNIRDNYSVASQKKTNKNKLLNFQNNSIRNLNSKKCLRESSRQESVSKRKKKISNFINIPVTKKYNNNIQRKIQNKSFVADEYKQYFGELNKKKGVSKIKKEIKNAWMEHSYKNTNNYKDSDKKRQIEKQHKQKLKRIQTEAQKLRKQQQQLIKDYQKQKKKEKRKQNLQRNHIRHQPKLRMQTPNARLASRNRNNETRNNNRPRQARNQQRHERYPTVEESYYEQIPINHPHRTLNFISQTINEQFQMMKQQFEHMNQFFSNFVPFSNNGFVYFERGQSSDYSIDSSGQSVGYDEEEEEKALYQEQIEMLPRYAYTKRLGVDDQCAVCISSIKHNEMVRGLPCHHVFHSDCIDEWLKRKAACPVCRQQIDDLDQ